MIIDFARIKLSVIP